MSNFATLRTQFAHGTNLSSIVTKANLQEGIVYALHQMDLAIQASGSATRSINGR